MEENNLKYTVGATFNNGGKAFFFLTDLPDLKIGDLIVCETIRGIELGTITIGSREAKENDISHLSAIIRIATPEDIILHEQNLIKSKEAVEFVQSKSRQLELNMKIISADYMLDSSKIVVSYLADERVDFRELLKVLAAGLKCRIELRQIGTRDKAKMIGGIGICGLKLCCTSFLNEFDGISITMAKNQMLALNIPKLSGHCGKLICCLKYEDSVYTKEKEGLPRVGERVNYENAIYKITSINIITKLIRIENSDTCLTLPYAALKGKVIPKEQRNDKK